MPKFVVERDIPGLGAWSAAQRRKAAEKSRAVLREMGPDIQWLVSYVTGDRLYCVYVAASAELIKEHAARGGFPCNRVSEVRGMMDLTTAESDA